jgi:hypothetical protein
MLDGLGASGGQQPDHLRHRVKNRATGPDSGECILYSALRGQPSNVGQGRVLLSRSARRCAATPQAKHHAGFPTSTQPSSPLDDHNGKLENGKLSETGRPPYYHFRTERRPGRRSSRLGSISVIAIFWAIDKDRRPL